MGVGGRGQLEAVLDQGLQAHVLQDRQHVGQGHGGAGAVELEAEGQLVVVGVAEGADPHLLVGERSSTTARSARASAASYRSR